MMMMTKIVIIYVLKSPLRNHGSRIVDGRWIGHFLEPYLGSCWCCWFSFFGKKQFFCGKTTTFCFSIFHRNNDLMSTPFSHNYPIQQQNTYHFTLFTRINTTNTPQRIHPKNTNRRHITTRRVFIICSLRTLSADQKEALQPYTTQYTDQQLPYTI